jgi:hypothetical protein
VGFRGLFCWSWWVRFFGFWCHDFVGFAELGVLAAAGFERVQGPDVATFELADGAFERFGVVQGMCKKVQIVEVSGSFGFVVLGHRVCTLGFIKGGRMGGGELGVCGSG